ncbi:hypothetical protein RUA4292_00838 [Ruegeria atlantica]|uniref:Uncharacterized protein n=1 Tax=Ruegeria atlantica TaxID=81569 RepID=A0A0P1EVP5_9RHOB|nr:hypothetical protein RUA4292_00838 [Ruegeria atlantica]
MICSTAISLIFDLQQKQNLSHEGDGRHEVSKVPVINCRDPAPLFQPSKYVLNLVTDSINLGKNMVQNLCGSVPFLGIRKTR